MKKTTFIAGLLLFYFTISTVVFACEPCSTTLNLRETVEKSDIIILGQRTDYSPGIEPESIKVNVIKVFKGDVGQSEITVNSWNGMCAYGIVVDDKKYVIFLEKKEKMYDAINSGCSVTTYPFENDLIDIDGDEVSLSEFMEKIEGSDTKKVLDDELDAPLLNYFIPSIIIFILVTFIVLKKKKSGSKLSENSESILR